MAVDRPSDDGVEEITAGRPEKLPEYAAGPEIEETRTPAEYYSSLRAAVDRAYDGTSQSADTGGRSAWDDIPASDRPPLDALRVPAERATHILDGDERGGGHRSGTGSPGKTEFPADWGDETILNAIMAVAHSPQDVHRQWNQRWKARGEVDDVLISVIITPGGAIWTTWPEEGGPGVVRNPEAGGQ